MSLWDRIILWLQLPTKQWVRKQISEIELNSWARNISPRHWSQPHNFPLPDEETKRTRIVPDGYPFSPLFKTDSEALTEFYDEILERWFLTEWDSELEKLILDKESKQQNNEPKTN